MELAEFLNDDKISRTRWRQKSEKKRSTLIEILTFPENKQTNKQKSVHFHLKRSVHFLNGKSRIPILRIKEF